MTKDSKNQSELLSPEEADKIAIEHMEYADRLAKSMLSKWRASLHQSDITSLVGYAVTEASQHFKPSIGVNFKTFCYYYLKGVLVKEIDFNLSLGKNIALTDSGDKDTYFTESLHENTISSDYQQSEYESPELHLQKKQLIDLCFSNKIEISEFERSILTKHFVEEFSITELSEMMDYSRSHLSRVKSGAIRKIREYLLDSGELEGSNENSLILKALFKDT